MGEGEVARASEAPRTRRSLAADLRALGVGEGDLLLVHTSLSSLGWVAGAAPAVVEALLDAVGEAGTLVMPGFTSHLSEPSHWQNPPVPEAWWPVIRAEMVAFDPRTTPVLHVGAVPEAFRSYPGVLRSSHPQSSFLARGPRAAEVVAEHPLESSFGASSPLGRLRDLGARVLLLGAGFGACTCFHLAEELAEAVPRKREGAPVRVDGARVWREFDALDYDADPFPGIGEEFERGGAVLTGTVGSATARLFALADAVDHALGWYEARAG